MIAVNFNILNQKGAPAVYEDTAANRPAAGQSGRLFIATDTKILQRDNGTSYDTIGDNSLLGANNGLTLSGNDVQLGGSLTKHTAITGNYNIALGNAAVSNIKFLVSESLTTIIDGASSVVGSKTIAISTDASTQNFYSISGNLALDLSNAKITGANTLNATALNGYTNIGGNNGQSTRAIRSIMATGVFNNVNLAEFRSIDIKAYDFNGTNAITNAYGLYIDTIKAGAVTNAYGIYQSGVNDKNYFAGAVDIGSALTGTSATFNGGVTINTNGTSALFSTYKGANSDGYNIFIGGGGQSSVGEVGVTYKGSYNSFNGLQSGYSNTTGYHNTFNGVQSGYSNTTGTHNTFNGVNSGLSNTTGYYNTFNGVQSGFENTGGASNTFIGYNTGRGVTTGNANTILGANVTGLAAGLSNYVILADGDGNRRINIPSTGNVLINTTTDAGYKLDVNGTGNFSGALTGTSASFSGTVKLQGYTVATLPTGTVGMTAYVTDALAPTFGATLVGGGAVTTKAFFNGTNWVNE